MIEISRDEFDMLGINRKIGMMPERAWFKSEALDLASTIVKDPIDDDWAYVILTKGDEELYEFHSVEHSLASREDALQLMEKAASKIEVTGILQEQLYEDWNEAAKAEELSSILTIDDEIKAYLKKNPEKLYELTPRKFEELIASILRDLGFDVHLTQATRDGGRDIVAYVKTAVTSFLTFVECKRYAPNNKVGVDIVRQVVGVHDIRQATKSLIVTTSTFTKDAVQEARLVEHKLDLKDYGSIKEWLSEY